MRPYHCIAGAKTLLDGKPYVPAEKTDIVKTWLEAGWIPPAGHTHTDTYDNVLPQDYANPRGAQRSYTYAQSIHHYREPRGSY